MQATAHASANCTSRVQGGGKARGCAASKATAKAFQAAYTDAHASASAKAFAKYCSCGDAGAWAFGNTDQFIKLVDAVYAEASAAACAEGAHLLPTLSPPPSRAIILTGSIPFASIVCFQ